MNTEPTKEVYALTVFADAEATRPIVHVTMQGEVLITDDLRWPEAARAITQLGQTVFKLRNDDAIRIADERTLDEQVGSRPRLKQEVLRLKAEVVELKAKLVKEEGEDF